MRNDQNALDDFWTGYTYYKDLGGKAKVARMDRHGLAVLAIQILASGAEDPDDIANILRMHYDALQ